MKKRAIIIMLIFGVVLCSCSIRHFFDGTIERIGIDKYYPGLSSVSLCAHLTCRDDKEIGNGSFIEQYNTLNSYFRFKRKTYAPTSFETVFLRLDYGSDMFTKAYNDVKNQPGFDCEILFNYNDFAFHLNTTYSLSLSDAKPDYSFDGDNSYIKWINIVGEDEINNSLIFFGFFYSLYRGPMFIDAFADPYHFESWEILIQSYFDVDPWGSRIDD